MTPPAPIMPNARTKSAIIRGASVPAIRRPGDVVRLLVDATSDASALGLGDATRALDALTRLTTASLVDGAMIAQHAREQAAAVDELAWRISSLARRLEHVALVANGGSDG